MNEFRIHHDVNELLSLLRVHGGEGAEVYIDLLQKNRTPYVTTSVSAHSAKVGHRDGIAGSSAWGLAAGVELPLPELVQTLYL